MLVDWNLEDFFENVVYIRLNAVDVLEFSVVYFVKIDGLKYVFCKRMGYLSLCVLYFFLNQFVYLGWVDLCEEFLKDGMEC